MIVFLSQVLIPTAVASVAAVLLLGLINMMRGGNPCVNAGGILQRLAGVKVQH
jgi:hypothetical protein